ncbi:putative meiotic DNA recombinase assembly [Lyophyllum shimeji]|uniref:Meiotic DNA recombinase assembly n=1 Tax=Lyophyllum shimeji TaxID=47721 RepID=A0A9P3PIY3_LYOSH|nr:putative meiotic DNA recombinase assembly [Lyophyllum shimeji]
MWPLLRDMLDEIQSESLATLLTSVHVETSPVGLTHIRPLDAHLFSTANNPVFTSSLKRGDVIEIQGAPSSGKTHLLYHLLIICVIPSTHHSTTLGGWGKAAVVFDMDHNFDIVRFNRLLRHRITRLLGNDAPDIENVVQQSLQRLRVFRPHSSLQLSVTISDLAKYHSDHVTHEEIGIVAIDSMSAHYWPDRFVAQQMRTAAMSSEHAKEAQAYIPPLRHVLLALESFRRTHSPVIIMTNWGLHSASKNDPFLYRQHLHPFPAPFPHSHPTTSRRDAPATVSVFHEDMPRLTCHITVHQDVNKKSDSPGSHDDRLDLARKGKIVGLIRTPNATSVGKFLLYITNDEVLAD